MKVPPYDRLKDILEAIAQIEKYTEGGRQVFDQNELIQIWMVHYVQIIGEAVRALDPAFRNQHPQVPWRDIAGMRNILVHDYGKVNLNVVWEVAATHLPKLKQEIEIILAQLTSEN